MIVTLKNGSLWTYGRWPSLEGLALKLGISERVLYRYLAESRKQEQLDDRERETIESESSTLDSFTNSNTKSTTELSIYRKEAENVQERIRHTLARTRQEIIATIMQGGQCGLMDAHICSILLGRYGITAKEEHTEGGTRVLIEGITSGDAEELDAITG